MYRDETTSEHRSLELHHTIDPGFVNRRLVETILGPKNMPVVDTALSKLPPLPDGLMEARIDHVYSDILVVFCELNGVKTLGEVLASGDGHLFCSTERFEPCADVYDKPRATSVIIPPGLSEYEVRVEYSTKHLRSDTVRMHLHNGETLSVIAKFWKREGNCLFFQPLVIGGPWMSHENEAISDLVMWEAGTHFENFLEDFREFERVSSYTHPVDINEMRHVSERAFKLCLAEILGDKTRKDWGGETSDHFTSELHLQNRRLTGAFLLKGPAKFAPMGLNHLGKNNDQIYRLAQEPADVLFVQHCHEIESAVRATLRAFAVQPGRPRRYCLVDGKDSLRLLKAYGLYEKALELSQSTS